MDAQDFDGAEATLALIDEASLPSFVQVTYRTFKIRLKQSKGKGTALPGDNAMDPSDFLKEAFGIAGKNEEAIRKKLLDTMKAGGDLENNLMNTLKDIIDPKKK